MEWFIIKRRNSLTAIFKYIKTNNLTQSHLAATCWLAPVLAETERPFKLGKCMGNIFKHVTADSYTILIHPRNSFDTV
jgi:hypothetical protein